MLIKSCFKLRVFIILVSAFMAGSRIFFCLAAEPSRESVENISRDKYFPAVKQALKSAKKSIYMVMYFVNFDPKSRKSPINELVEELVNAHKRGVKVKVILDQNISFAVWEGRGGKWEREPKNDPLFGYLKKQGIETYYDNLFVVTHSKSIVIDEEVVILGSANWTESSLRRNWEASCLIRSKELAKQFLEDFSKITIDYEASILDEERIPPVRLIDSFLKDSSFAPRMVTARDETAFDLYLLLLRTFNGNSEGRVDIDYKSISSTLGLDEKFSYVSARDILREALVRLDQRYKLITRIKRSPKSPYCLLLNYPNKKPYILPQEKYCSIPDEYWQYGWNKRLSFPEKYFFLINLCKAGASRGRVWTGYRKGLMEEFNLSRDTIIRGVKGLRRLNIIEIEYPPYPEGGGFAKRSPIRFRLLGLYSPEILQQEKERLAKLYGKEHFEQAKKYAGIVFKDNDIQVIEDIIKKMEEYGSEQIDEAFSKVSYRSPDNPKRSYKYVVGILQTEATE
ncbi:MAG: phospholipase D-like domain-containing protein [Candidatus Omnitrophota bacterium]